MRSRAQLHHQCERCGLIAVLERSGRFRDEDFYELLHEYFELEQHMAALLSLERSRLSAAYERIEQMRELMT